MPSLLEGHAAISHLFRRAGFGADAATLDAFAGRPYDEAVDRLLADLDGRAPADPREFDPYAPGAIQQAWLERMRSGVAPLAEKLAFFWHGHFATSDAKVADPALLWGQYRLLRERGAGRFPDLVLALSRDVAMVRWLDGNANRSGRPNENYARELQELFALGVGHYTEDDVRAAARAFTGWGSRHHEFVFDAAAHDHGPKRFHGVEGDFDGADIVRIVTSKPECHLHVATKLWRFFVAPDPTGDELAVTAAILGRTGGDIKAALSGMLRSDGFRALSRHRALVKSPVEAVIGALRAAGVPGVPPWVHGVIARAGQTPFRPPSVKGWTSGAGWLGATPLVERLRAAQWTAASTPPMEAARIVAIALDGRPSPELAAALAHRSGRDAVAWVLASPEFQLA